MGDALRRFGLVIALLVLVALGGGLYALDRWDKAQFGIPRFYAWKALSGQYHGAHRANVNGVSIYYETYGKGPPVVAISGAMGFVESMNGFITALAPTHTVIAVDSRGQGRSSDAPGPITYRLMGDDMIKLLDTLHVPQADVVGWSDGGIIGLDMAMQHPDRVRRLVAIGANYDLAGIEPAGVQPAAMKTFAEQLRPFYRAIGADPRQFDSMVSKVSTMVATLPDYTVAELGAIRARTAVVAGEHDTILRKHTDSLAAAIHGATEIIVPGATHFGPIEQPKVYQALTLKFLDGP